MTYLAYWADAHEDDVINICLDVIFIHFYPASNSSLEDNFKKLLIYFKFTYYIIKPLLLAYAIEDEIRYLKKCNPNNCIKYHKADSSGRKFSEGYLRKQHQLKNAY